VTDSHSDELRRDVAQKRRELEELEARVRKNEREELDRYWFPQGFYTAYYILSGLVLGVIASWISLALNVAGAALVGEHPLEILRVYSTILGGAKTAEGSDAVVLMFALGVHTFTGAVCGAPIHVVYSRFFVAVSLGRRVLAGILLGIAMWLVNFYGVLVWLQPLLHHEPSSYIVDHMPAWVAVLTHVAFTSSMLALQPLAIFNTRNYPEITTRALSESSEDGSGNAASRA